MNSQDRRLFRGILSVIFLDNLGLTVVYPIFTFLVLMPDYGLLPEDYTLSIRMVLLGILIATFPIAQFIASPILSHIADVKGRKQTLTLSLAGEAVGFLCAGIAIKNMNYPLLIVSRALSGFFAGNMSICLGTIANFTSDPKVRSRNFGIVSSVMGISFVIAIIIGGTLSNASLNMFFNPALPFWAITILAIVNLGWICCNFKETNTSSIKPPDCLQIPTRQIIKILRKNHLTHLYFVFFFFMLGWIISLQFLSSCLIEHFSTTQIIITYTFITIGVAWCVGNMWINRLLARILTPMKILSYALLLTTLSLFVAAETKDLLIFLHVIVFGGLCASLAWANCLSLISKTATELLQGKLLSINQSVATISMVIAPLFGGMIGLFDIKVIYFFATLSILISVAILMTFNLKKNKNTF